MVLKRRFSASQLLPDVRRYGVTVFHYVGKALAYVLATPEQPDDADNPLRLASGNEAADLDIGRFHARFGCPVADGFGSTEGGVYVSRTPDTPAGSIGKPQPGVDILDPDTGDPVPPGRFDREGRLLNPDEAIGELVNTSGGGAFEGYYNDDEANAERMRGGMYWSGDLAYKDEDGFFYFAGRSTEWLRVDGENFGAAPVERLMARYGPVSQVAVYGVPAPDVGDDLMVTVKLHAGQRFDPADFVAFLHAQPDLGTKWMPRYVRVATALPETETNKVVKRALARQQWFVDDPVWWREGRDSVFAPLDTAARAAIAERFAANGRTNLLTG
jgi:fatty-acyl-CoA synthase